MLAGSVLLSRASLQMLHSLGRSSILLSQRPMSFWSNFIMSQLRKKPDEPIIEDKGAGEIKAIGSYEDAPKVPQVILLPNHTRPLIPGYSQPYRLANDQMIQKIVDSADNYVGVFLRRDCNPFTISTTELIKSVDEVYDVGCLARVMDIRQTDKDAMLTLIGQRRIRIKNVISTEIPFLVEVEHIMNPEVTLDSKVVSAYMNEVMDSVNRVFSNDPAIREVLNLFSMKLEKITPFRACDLAGGLSSQGSHSQQTLMGAVELEDRFKASLQILREELELMDIQKHIREQVEGKISEQQRVFFLNEQLKSIKKELGLEKDEVKAILEKYQKKLEEIHARCTLPAIVQQTIDEECEKFSTLEKTSSEFTVTRNYLDWLTSLPWGLYTPDNFDIPTAKAILDEDHYGLTKVKDQILEILAMGSLKGSIKGTILCLVGPPGTGKTSISSSIARAYGRKFARFSVGGLSDTSEIKGHRRTYIGSLPGKIIQSLKQVQSSNPVILIDEIDKMGKDFRGDPASALLELLDPNQNSTFVDHYLDVPVDLSKTLFICTANSLDTIPTPLLDRFVVIDVSGYDIQEKKAITRRHLLPKLYDKNGLLVDGKSDEPILTISDDMLEYVIQYYCMESGVRSLEKSLQKILQKTALEICTTGDKSQRDLTKEKIEVFLGPPKFIHKALYETTPAGIVPGLAWTSYGGCSLFIESVSVPKLPVKEATLKLTGQLGDVMKESASIAYSYAKIFLNKPIRQHLAMTGEISLTGKVLPVGGVKEKSMAAVRAGMKEVIIPKDNERDLAEISPYVKESLKFHFASSYEDVFQIAFSEKFGDRKLE